MVPQPTEPGRTPLGEAVPRPGVLRYSAIWLLAALALLFLSAPFIEDLPGGDLIEAVLMTCVMMSAVLAVGGRERTLMFALLLVAPALGGKWANHFWPSRFSAVVYLFSAVVFLVFVVINLIRFILRARRVDANVLCAGLSGYLLLGLLWSPAYVMVAQLNAGAFNLSKGLAAGASMDWFNAFYFSFMTLCTVGYGDITPVSKGARMLAVMEAIVGLFYMAVLISRLVAIYSANPPPPDTDTDSPAT